jgi:hypothetical protein
MPTIEEVRPGTVVRPDDSPGISDPNGTEPEPAPSPDVDPELPGDSLLLTEPIEVGGRIRQRLDRLKVNSTKLMYNDYAELKRRYIRDVPKAVRREYDHESEDPEFLKLMICMLNPPMITEDFNRLSMADAMAVFKLAQGLIFSARFAKMGAEKMLSLS